MSTRFKLKVVLLVSAVTVLVSGCGDRLSSTYPKMKAFVSDAGFIPVQVPSPANLGPTAPWFGIARQLGSEYIVVIYPTKQKLYTVPLGVDGRLTRSQMMEALIHKGYQQVDKRLWLKGQAVNDEDKVLLLWVYSDENGFPSKYFDLRGNQLDFNVPPEMSIYVYHPETVFSFQG